MDNQSRGSDRMSAGDRKLVTADSTTSKQKWPVITYLAGLRQKRRACGSLCMMSKELDIYLQVCKGRNVMPQDYIKCALELSADTGELDLSGKTETTWGWEVIGKILVSSSTVHTLVLRDCLISPRGLAVIIGSLCQNATVHTIDLRGNNIQTTSVTQLGKLLRHNSTIRGLSLEWNSFGIYPDTMSLFCDALTINQSLQLLDLKNNQISSDCAPYLANAIRKNTSLKILDLRWNNLGCKGGQQIQSAMQFNRTLYRVRVQGNCMPDDLVRSIEQAGRHNEDQEKLKNNCQLKTDFLVQHLKVSEENREGLKKKSQEKIQEVVKESESRISDLEGILSEQLALVTKLQDQVASLHIDLKASEKKTKTLEELLVEKEEFSNMLHSNHQKELENLKKKLADNEETIVAITTKKDAELSTEKNLKRALENKVDSQTKDLKQLEREIQKHSEKLRLTRQEQEECLLSEHALSQALLLKAERESEARFSKLQSEVISIRTSLQERIKELEKENEGVEKRKAELSSLLVREQAKCDEAVAVATQKARVREEQRVSQLEDKLAQCREEKSTLEKQLSLVHATTSQLQQHNTALVAEMAEPHRKLTKMHEELSMERLANQRLQLELAEEGKRSLTKQRDMELLQVRLQEAQAHVSELSKVQVDREREKQAHSEQLKSVLAERDRELRAIRVDEAERVGALYSAFNKYLGSLAPGAQTSRTTIPL